MSDDEAYTNHTHRELARIARQLADLTGAVKDIAHHQATFHRSTMTSLDEVLALQAQATQAINDAAARVTTVITTANDSHAAQLAELKAEIAKLQPDPAAQAKIDALAAGLQNEIATVSTIATATTTAAAGTQAAAESPAASQPASQP